MSMKRLLNENVGSKLTEELVTSLVELYPEELARLDAFEAGARVVVRRDYLSVKDAGKVALISGGGSGHEPSHAGLCGEGLLTAAVCGDVFASPSAKAVLCAIVTCSSKAGCLLIVKNYTGDRLNFGLAAETARSEWGIDVETVYVCDDVALPDSKQPRGLAGTYLVQKIAGAVAARGGNLREVAEAARSVARATATMGVAYEICCMPDLRPRTTQRLRTDGVELGLGIHGEPGAAVIDAPSADACADLLVDATVAKLDLKKQKVALLVNNLGSTTAIEMTVFANACKRSCAKRGLTVGWICVGSIMTSLDMHGASLTVCDSACLPDFEECLMAPASSPGCLAWRKMTAPLLVAVEPRALADDEPEPLSQGEIVPNFLALVEAGCSALVDAEEQLTAMDTIVGDGDCGTTLKQGAEAVLADVKQRGAEYATPARCCALISAVLARSMGGSSGVLYTLGCRAAQAKLNGTPQWSEAFVAFAEAISHCGGAGVGSRTMCDATLPAAEVFRKGGSLAEAALAARKGADSTEHLTATHGRTAYIAEDRQRGVFDPGAVAVALILEALAKKHAALTP